MSIVSSSSSPKTPGSQALLSLENEFKIPKHPAPKRKIRILDEDTYIEEMGKIIERDFFPDLQKLKAQNDYLDALEKNDIKKMRELYERYSGGKPPTERLASPATFETPVDLHELNKSDEPETESTPKKTDGNSDMDDTKKARLSLDGYLSVHTSEDNQSFEEIMHESERKHRQKYAYLYNEESKSEDVEKQLLALPSIDQQAQLPDKPFNVDTWSYKNKNYIMYVPDGVELTLNEKIEMSKRRQEVLHGNTRLLINPFDEKQNKETISELAKSQAKNLDGRIGVDGKELTQSDTPQIRGFGFVRTPSPCPGAADSPLMTWGQIEGTPFRLDGSDTPIPRSQGPSFKIAETSKREQIALALAEKVGEHHRDKKMKAIAAARRQFATPSPSPSSLHRLASMSPAARRLATSKLGDLALRASYSPSPRRQSTGSLTPRSNNNLGQRTPKPNSSSNLDLTDNLLNIPFSKRAKASDFF